ncbi:protein DYAD isoform X2 [Rhodamnia argentea]|uniref:Protein DYAD isoform X2 n=1 Tax=Rhodamnia argentea TaxID=178133 RepID=A0ABM3GUK0_9MYRT|nr:protein DYAD isoform X2 [Rhodamnia argentea]
MLNNPHCGSSTERGRTQRSCEDSHFDHIIACKVEGHTSEGWEEASKKGLCWFELQRIGMAQWVSDRQAPFSGQDGERKSKLSACTAKDDVRYDEGEAGTAESPVMYEKGKRKHLFQDVKPYKRGKAKQKKKSTQVKAKSKRRDHPIDRWSAERYTQAEQSLLEILKAEGAIFGNPIRRPELRLAGRRRIGDTGLLDHLLKHVDGKVAPGGKDRFRRWHNTDGVMEYWLESADLADIRREAGVQDPFWIPPSGWKPGDAPAEQTVSAAEFEKLKEEMANMKRDFQELVDKKPGQGQLNLVEEMYKELMNWKAKTSQRLMEISSSLSGMQGMYKDLIAWKTKTEQQLAELSNSLSTMAAKQHKTTLSPPASERWEDWLESTNLDNIQAEDIAPWLESADVGNFEGNAVMQNPFSSLPRSKPVDGPMQNSMSARELEVAKEGVAMFRNSWDLVPRKHDGAVDNGKQGAFTVNSKMEFDNSFLLLQEMFKELAKWKGKVEQQLVEINNAVSNMQTARQFTSFGPSTFYL